MSPPSTPRQDSSYNEIQYDISSQIVLDISYSVHETYTSISTDPLDPSCIVTSSLDISINLLDVIQYYDDVTDISSQTMILYKQIQQCAAEIDCCDFHGKGTIDDYTALFQAASQMCNETTQIELDVDIEGFNEISTAAEELSQLFSSFTLKLQNVNVIYDVVFLTAVLGALRKLVYLSEVFGEFKITVQGLSSLKIPKSIHDTVELLKNVIGEITCGMRYIEQFVCNDKPDLTGSQLCDEEKEAINDAVVAIQTWEAVCTQGAASVLAGDDDVEYIATVNADLKNLASRLQTQTQTLRQKLLTITTKNC